VNAPTVPRIAPLDRDELSPRQAEVLEGMPDLNLLRTMVRHPDLCERWVPFGSFVGRDLSPRDRELVILRTARKCDCAYEWGQHAGRAAAILSEDEIRRIGDPAPFDGDDDDSAVLRAVDDLVDDHCVSEETWALLNRRFGEQELLDLMMCAGQVVMLSGVLNTLGIQGERPLAPLGEPVTA